MGIEPTRPAWKAGVLPLNYTRITRLGCTDAISSTIISQEMDGVKDFFGKTCVFPLAFFQLFLYDVGRIDGIEDELHGSEETIY